MPKGLKSVRPARVPAQDKNGVKRQNVFVGSNLAKLFVMKHSAWNERASSLFTSLVEEAFKNASLRLCLREFYISHIDYFETSPARTRLIMNVDTLTADLASTLSFKLFRQGNISGLFRLLTLYHAVQEGLLEPPRQSNHDKIEAARIALGEMPSGKLERVHIDPQKHDTPNSVKTIYTVTPATVQGIQILMNIEQKKKMALVRTLIERGARKVETGKIRNFYQAHRQELDKIETPMVPMRLNLPDEIDTLHYLLAAKLFDSPRMKSKALRVVVAYYASLV